MKLDKVIVVDIEATCWEPKPTTNSKEYTSEIIEIGLCMVNLVNQRVELFGREQKRSILVKPRYSKVSKFCTELTTLTQEQVDTGVSFEHACRVIEEEYKAKDYTWVSYGDYDRKQFQDECRSKGVNYPFSQRHINIKNVFALMYQLDKEVGMPTALEKLGLPLDGTHHRGVDDAMNIAKIVHKVFQKRK